MARRSERSDLFQQLKALLPLAWLAVVVRDAQGWSVREHAKLTHARRAQLDDWLGQASYADWVAKASAGGRVYQRKLGTAHADLMPRLCAVGVQGGSALLVGLTAAKPLTRPQQAALRLAAQALAPATASFSTPLVSTEEADPIQTQLSQLAEQLGTERITLFKHEPDEGILRAVHAPHTTLLVDGTLEGSVLRIGESVRIDHIARHSRYAGLHADSQSRLVAPLRFAGETLGVLSVESAQADHFDPADEAQVEAVAAQLAVGLAFQAVEAAQAQLRRAVIEVAAFSAERLDPDALAVVAQPVADILARIYAFDLVLFLVPVRASGEFLATGVSGTAAEVPHGLRLAHDFGLPGAALSGRHPIEAYAPATHPIYDAVPGWEAGYAVSVPIYAGDEVIAVVNAESSAGRPAPVADLADFAAVVNLLPVLFASNALAARVEELHSAQEMTALRLQRTERLAAVGELAAGVAHELNNPLTTVAGFSELVLETLPEEAAERADLQIVVTEARRAREVVRRLLDFSRQDEFLHAAADIHEVIAGVLALFNHQAQLADIEIRARLWDDLPVLRVDKSQMQQVFINLLQNAIQAMPEGGTIDIQTGVGQRELQDWVTIRLSDSGVGISDEHLAHIFEPFFTTRADQEGTGLGLAISYNIVAEHGGFIEVDSRKGQGAAFTIWLPVQPAAGPLLQPQEVEQPHG